MYNIDDNNYYYDNNKKSDTNKNIFTDDWINFKIKY